VALGALLVAAAMLQLFPRCCVAEPEWFAWWRPNSRHSSVQIYRQRAASLSSAIASKQRRRFGLPAVSSSRDLCIFRRLSAPEARVKQESVTGSTRLSGMPVSMRNALTQGFSSTLLIERRQRYSDVLGRTVRDGIPFGDVVAMHFRLAATSTVAD